jgi:hypothetical protein
LRFVDWSKKAIDDRLSKTKKIFSVYPAFAG